LNQVGFENGTCVDSPGRGLGDNLAFQVDKDYLTGGVINTKPQFRNDFFTADFRDYVADSCTFSGRPLFPLITSYPGEQSSAAYAAAAIARTTPNHPYVDVVQNVLEAGDIPRVLMIRANTLVKMVANEYLRLQFGIKPLVKDIKRTLNWAENVHKRLDQLQKLRDTGGYRKTVTLDELTTAATAVNQTMQSSGCFLSGTIDSVGQRTIRGHVRYLPTQDFKKFSQREMLAMAKRSVFGVELSLSGLWEGMPWSWLIDWYTNIGDLLMQTRNIVPVTVQSVTLMRSTTTNSRIGPLTDNVRDMSVAKVVKERKERYPASATLDAHLPLLDAGQMGILASLLIMKGKSPYRG
jgi:hypothetical protein